MGVKITYVIALPNCPRDPPRGVSIGGKRVSSASGHGESHIFFRYAVKSHFEKEKLRRLKIQYQEFLSRDRLFVSYEYSRIF